MILPLPYLVTFSPCLFLHFLRLPTSYLTSPSLPHSPTPSKHPPPPSLTPPSPSIASITSSSILLYRLRHFILVCSPTPPYSPPSLPPPSSFAPPPLYRSITSSSIPLHRLRHFLLHPRLFSLPVSIIPYYSPPPYRPFTSFLHSVFRQLARSSNKR